MQLLEGSKMLVGISYTQLVIIFSQLKSLDTSNFETECGLTQIPYVGILNSMINE